MGANHCDLLKRDPHIGNLFSYPPLLQSSRMATSIHLCPANTGIPNPTFKAKGIAGKMPSKIADVPVYAYPKYVLENQA
jgi:hypothetical protein